MRRRWKESLRLGVSGHVNHTGFELVLDGDAEVGKSNKLSLMHRMEYVVKMERGGTAGYCGVLGIIKNFGEMVAQGRKWASENPFGVAEIESNNLTKLEVLILVLKFLIYK